MLHSDQVFIGIAPIGWCNDDMPELGGGCTFEQIVSEMALSGFRGCEIGNKYPAAADELRRALTMRNLRVASQWFSSLLLTTSFRQNEERFAAALDFLTSVGADRINVSEQSYSIQGQMQTPILAGRRRILSDSEMRWLCDGLGQLGKIAASRGFKMCYHHHMGTVVQTAQETETMLELTDARHVHLCYDTGHFAFMNEDPAQMLKKFSARVGHVHLKDVRKSVIARCRQENWSFLKAVRMGAFTTPGDGDIDFTPIFEQLSEVGYMGWLLVEAEQDPAKADPLEYAMKARAYIADRTGL